MVICRGANDLHMVRLMPHHPIISCSSKIQNGLPFWCRLIQVVLEKRPLNGCSSSSVPCKKFEISSSCGMLFSLQHYSGQKYTGSFSTRTGRRLGSMRHPVLCATTTEISLKAVVPC